MAGLSASLAIDESGKVYGKLTVIRRLEKRDESGSFTYECICQCGTTCEINTHQLRGGVRAHCGSWKCGESLETILNSEEPAENAIKNSYFAGHFDGEGCIIFANKGGSPALSARVSNVYKPTIIEYRDYFGGGVRCIAQSSGRNGRLQWGWCISAQKDVLRFVKKILPYSKEKRSQLELAMEWLKQRIEYGKHNNNANLKARLPEYKLKMEDLKKYEWTN